MGKIIAFSNQKGGVGKTTTCVNMSAYLAQKGYKCLMVDLDPQGNATSGLGFSKSEIKSSVYNVMIDDMPIEDAVVKTCVDNLDILPSSIDLAGAEVELVYVKSREHVLKNVLEKAKGSYDFITIDCPPSLGLLNTNALTAADSVIIPVQCEYYALEGLTQLLSTIRLVQRLFNEKLVIEGVLLTMFDARTKLSVEVQQEVRKYFKESVYKSYIPRNVRLAEAPSHGLPINLYDTKSAGAEGYRQLADEVIERGVRDWYSGY